MSTSSSALAMWQKLSRWPGGAWLFSRLICLKAPYFGSIRPRFMELRPGYCRIRFAKRRAVLNHIGTVHAIAMCNLAELAGGTMTEVTIPSSHRWIPKGMTVEYLKKASTDVVGVAMPQRGDLGAEGADYPVLVEVHDLHGELVFRATITMWVSPRK
ncbi:hotdog fold domain-containing protein [Dyella sp. BiH032]|uniref:hotdog fold domain-containing protein n=1 Tax=Dyella sp. BiH032 TaxID=3075430 RepID=UPI002892E10D|nr:hotdog fold domain-containing protein [Dyella sp. BiH032]WNL45390.1 hotdog fold domain-containing protein [Dyella sp. BiH032]